MSSLDDISRSIGALEAEVEHDRRSREIIHQKLEGISRQVVEMSQLMANVHRDVSMMQPEVQHYADARRRLAGGIAVLTFLAGGLGAGISEAAKLLLHR